MDEENIGLRISQLIEKLDLKKVEFAEIIKIDQSFI